jgi:hypothetical protein
MGGKVVLLLTESSSISIKLTHIGRLLIRDKEIGGKTTVNLLAVKECVHN